MADDVLKKVALGVLALVVVGSAGLFLWARSVLASDTVRTSIAARLGDRLGEPVTIGGIGASIFPRVGLTLDHVTIGTTNQIVVGKLAVATDFAALLSRRIEHATVRISDTHLTLPLPLARLASAAPTSSAPAPAGASSGLPVEIVSVDEIVLSGVQITSGGRTLTGDIDFGLQGQRVDVRKISLSAEGTTLNLTGTIADLAGPSGSLTLTAGALDVPALVAFVTDFANGTGATASASAPSASTTPPPETSRSSTATDITLAMTADRASLGGLSLAHLSGNAHLTKDAITVDPVGFDVFGGSYAGSLTLTLADVPGFHVKATLARVDMANVMTFAGHPGLVTGTMSGTLDVTGRGLSAADVTKSAHGTAAITMADGTVKGLGLMHGVIVATSMRTGAIDQATTSSTTEHFSKLGGTFTIANGQATTSDLNLTSDDVILSASGAVRLDGTSVNMAGPLQLSDALSKQAGRDLVTYLQKDGRVTVPVTVSGSADALHVGVDTGNLAKRAVTNAVADQAKKLLQNLGSSHSQ